jgi:hypothetical protein
VLPKALQSEAAKAQEAYLEEDPWVGIIQEWLDNTEHERVCVLMLWREALGHLYDEPKRSDINALHSIMKKDVAGWALTKKQRLGNYGIQRCYMRIVEQFSNISEIPFTDEIN